MFRILSFLFGMTVALASGVTSAQERDLSTGGDLDDFAIGKPDAPIEIIVYGNVLGGGHTSLFFSEYLPVLEREFVEIDSKNERAQIKFRHLLMKPMHIVDAMVARCIPRTLFFSFGRLHSEIANNDDRITKAYIKAYQNRHYEDKSEIDALYSLEERSMTSFEYITRSTSHFGLDQDRLKECLSDKDLESQVFSKYKQHMEDDNVHKIPTYVINGTHQDNIENASDLVMRIREIIREQK